MQETARKFGIFKHVAGKVYPAGTTIFREGDEGRVMYAVKRGEVDILVRGKVVDTMGEEEVFGEMALLERSSRAATAIARTETELVEIDEVHFNTTVQKNPYFALQMMQLLSERLRRADSLYK